MKKLIFLHNPLHKSHSRVRKLTAFLCHHFTPSIKRRNTVMGTVTLNYKLTVVCSKHIMCTKSCVSSRGKSQALNYHFYSNARKGFFFNLVLIYVRLGHAVAPLLEALRYKPEGCGFNSRWCDWIFSLT